MLHLAAQYLAAAGISFLEKKEDDSHTNIGFSVEEGSMYTRPLNDMADTLSLNYERFTLEWNSFDTRTIFRLNGATHEEVLIWLNEVISSSGFSTSYIYKFHYDLPYSIEKNFTYKLLNKNRLQELLHFRILAQMVLESFLEEHRLKSEIRVWPHHFDTGAFVTLEEGSGISIGLGLAVPDSICSKHYLYMSGYKGHESLDTSGFKDLSLGEWRAGSYKAAILPVNGIDEKKALSFFNEAFSVYKKHY